MCLHLLVICAFCSFSQLCLIKIFPLY
uniref:Uncharacterized protein n=1 Tax=Anguilla anguilla TaxID=7936 RepID=A0A0E9TD60_ANGAN